MKKGFNEYVLIYILFAVAIMKGLGLLEQQSLQGWIAIGLLAFIGIIIKKPAMVLVERSESMSNTVKKIVLFENIVVLFVAFQFEQYLLIALLGLAVILFTIYVGSRFNRTDVACLPDSDKDES